MFGGCRPAGSDGGQHIRRALGSGWCACIPSAAAHPPTLMRSTGQPMLCSSVTSVAILAIILVSRSMLQKMVGG